MWQYNIHRFDWLLLFVMHLILKFQCNSIIRIMSNVFGSFWISACAIWSMCPCCLLHKCRHFCPLLLCFHCIPFVYCHRTMRARTCAMLRCSITLRTIDKLESFRYGYGIHADRHSHYLPLSINHFDHHTPSPSEKWFARLFVFGSLRCHHSSETCYGI